MKPEAVFDTNVLVSGILWRGVPFQLLKFAENKNLTIYSSLEIMSEVYRVLHYPKFKKHIDGQHTSPTELFDKIGSLCELIQVEESVNAVDADPDDNKFLSCAVAGNCIMIVSGDAHLLDLKRYHDIQILTSRAFHQRMLSKT